MTKQPEPFQEQPERIWYSESRTINLGGYESIKIEHGYALSVQPDETTEIASLRCRSLVINVLNKREAKIREKIS